MEKIKYFKNFSIYNCKVSGAAILKLETNVNGHVNSFTIELCPADENRVKKILENYNNEIKEILDNGK